MKKNIIAMAESIAPTIVNDKTIQDQIWQNFLTLFNDFDQPTQKKIKLFIKLSNFLSYLKFFKSISRLNSEDRYKLLTILENFSIKPIMAGFFGIRSLIMLSIYGNKETWNQIDYAGPYKDN